jgi:hypothetical protein
VVPHNEEDDDEPVRPDIPPAKPRSRNHEILPLSCQEEMSVTRG